MPPPAVVLRTQVIPGETGTLAWPPQAEGQGHLSPHLSQLPVSQQNTASSVDLLRSTSCTEKQNQKLNQQQVNPFESPAARHTPTVHLPVRHPI